MGGTTHSRLFFQAIKESNERKAVELYKSSEELQSLDPNKPYGRFHRAVSPLHLAAKRGFFELLKLFMKNGGKADLVDSRGQTVVHHICRSSNGTDSIVDQTRSEMLLFVINICLSPEKICPDLSLSPQLLNLSRQDKALNTPLHLAAGSGLVLTSQVLLNHGAVVHITNVAGQTPFAVADSGGHREIVKLIEPKMVFTVTPESSLVVQKPETLRLESYQGVERDELQVIKTDLIQGTAAILDIPVLSAQRLLEHFGWSQVLVVDSWLLDPMNTCSVAKVKLPMARQTSLAVEVVVMKQTSREEHICEICGDPSIELLSNPDCTHSFCKLCWMEYFSSKVKDGKVTNIPCPGFGCEELVNQELVLRLLPSEMSAKFAHFDLGSFIEGNPNTRWCPHPGCERAVHLKSSKDGGGAGGGAARAVSDSSESSAQSSAGVQQRNVDCGAGHFFCWSCSEEAHDPCNCDSWKAWKSKIASLADRDISKATAASLSERATSEAWVAKNSKPCPKCKIPIQRSDGCNHMTCSKCNHDFCWACLGRWAIHSSRTGGYYTCNRFQALKRAKEHLEAMKQHAELESNKKNAQYFKHAYNRYSNHCQSLEFEEKMLSNLSEKVQSLMASAQAAAVTRLEDQDKEGQFAKDAIRELLKSRLVLRASYALSYYTDGEKRRDELLKLIAPLEKSTEGLAEMIARPHLCTPKDKIVLGTIESRLARRVFIEKARGFNTQKLSVPEFEDPEDDGLISDHTDTDTDTDTDSWYSSSPPTPDSPIIIVPGIPRAPDLPRELEILYESDDEYYWD